DACPDPATGRHLGPGPGQPSAADGSVAAALIAKAGRSARPACRILPYPLESPFSKGLFFRAPNRRFFCSLSGILPASARRYPDALLHCASRPMPRTVRPPRKPSASGKVLTIMGLSEQQAMSRTRSHPGDINAWKSLGAHCVESGRLAQGRTALERALAMAPRDAEALRVMADLEVKAGALENARARLDAALEIEPGHQLGRIKLAEILHRLGRHDDALQCLDQMGNP